MTPPTLPTPSDLPGDPDRAARYDRYEQMLRLADLFDDAGDSMRAWAALGQEVIADAEVGATVPFSAGTWARAEEELRALGTGRDGLLGRSVELDADALVLRATVLTYRWLEDLRDDAYRTLGSVADRAIGYLAPRVELGGSIVAAGLVETDVVDRDGVAAYLGELAETDPELMEHLTTGGGLLEALQMRELLTPGVPAGEAGAASRRGGRRAIGVAAMDDGWGAALRDVGGSLAEAETRPQEPQGPAESASSAEGTAEGPAPAGLGELMDLLTAAAPEPVRVLRVGPSRVIVLLDDAASAAPGGGRLRVVGTGDPDGLEEAAAHALAASAAADRSSGGGPLHVMLVGHGGGGEAAVLVAARVASGDDPRLRDVVIDQVVTADAPAVHLPRLPAGVRVLSLEDRADPVALLGSLVNAGASDRMTVVYAADEAAPGDQPASGSTEAIARAVAGGRAADRADDPTLVAVLDRWRRWGYLRSAG